ncbi:tripartite tricarboxylate transporter substrate binding protein [Alcaligenaceae bacterium]|nr:tripartite tricarboxylate transporter substrate binding protein [Alcaligenaceae bacterium]
MRTFFKTLTAALLLGFGVVGNAAKADNFPEKPVTIIVSVAPGGSLDALARLVATHMAPILGQSVVVENVTGAGGLIGFQRLLKSSPDGYTLMMSNNSMVLIPLLHPQAGIDVVKDTSPIGTVANVPMVLGVSNQSGIQSLVEMRKRMNEEDFVPNLGSGGPGTTAHLAEAMFLQQSGGAGQLIAYRGSGPALTDLMGGTIDGVIDQTVSMMHLHKNRIKAIAVTGERRLPQMPDVPTFAEAGMADFKLQIWYGLVAPEGTPKEVINALSGALTKVLDSEEYKTRIDQLAAEVTPQEQRGPEGFGNILARDQKELAELAQSIGLPAR